MSELRALEFLHGQLRLLDQRRLPTEIRWIETNDYRTVAEAIRTLAVRGAPAIGLTAAYATVLAAFEADPKVHDWRGRLYAAMDDLAATRPTAVNLFWALKRMRDLADSR